MYYTVDVKQVFRIFLGAFLTLTLAACGTGIAPTTASAPDVQNASLDTADGTPQVDSASSSRPVLPNRELQKSLPEVCDCVLRFDHLNIEQGMSQSSVHIIFQDSRGFLWMGTQDGLNRYDGYTFKIYKPDPDVPSSLSDRWITSILEDADGFLWIGTRQGGLNRFDPRLEKFSQFTHEAANPASLSDNHVNTLFIDRKGNLWVGTERGLDRLDKNQNGFKHFLNSLPQPDKTTDIRVTAMHQDRRGKFWVGTGGDGLIWLDPESNQTEIFQSNPENPSTISSDFVNAIVEDEKTYILWVGTRSGLNRFDPNTGRFTRFQRQEAGEEDPMSEENGPIDIIEKNSAYQSLSNNTINSLLFDSTGNLWVGTANGLNRYHAGTGFVHYFNDPAFSKSLSENSIASLYEDHSGILWIGTHGGGVNIYDRQRDLFAYYRHDAQDKNSINDNSITSIYVDSEGYAWVGTGNGLNRFSWTSNSVLSYQNNRKDLSSLGFNEVTSTYEDQDGTLWIGTFNGLDSFDRTTSAFTHYRRDLADSSSLSSNYVYTVFVDRQNNVWVGTYAGLDLLDRATGKFIHYAYQMDNPASLSGNIVITIYEDQEGNLWAGTFESGLNRLDRNTGAFTRYRYDPQDKTSLNNDSVSSIYQDSQARLWIATVGGGLNLYHPETDSFTYFIEKNGLPSGVIYGVLEDEQGYLWMSTNFGIARFNPDTKVFRNFDAGDGLQSNEFNSNAFAKGKHGELYFGGINGLTVFQPDRIVDNPYTPQVVLTSLTQSDQPVAMETSVEMLQSLTLQWPQNSLEFDFAALSFSEPGKNQYAYFLDNFDTNWHFIGTKRNGRYTNLPGGEYTLLVKGANSDGVWNDTPTQIAITVIPPFWQTNWFRVSLALAAALVTLGGAGLRTRSIRARNRALEGLVQDRTYALENRNREMEALYKADERILRNVSLNQVFQTLVDVAVDMLHADRSVVFAWDEKQTKVRPRVSHGYSPETLKVMEFAKGEGNVGKVLATGKPMIAPELDMEVMRPDVRTAIIAEGIRSFMHLPIVVDHKVVAVFNVAFTGPEFLSDDTVRVFTALVNRAAISIANMELFEQTKDLAVMEERNRLARDLHDSAKQKAFAALAQLGTARGILNGNGHLVTLHLNEAENLVSDVIQELTFLVQEIYPIALQEKGLATTLREYIFEWENRNDVQVNFSIRNECRLPLEIEQAIYRVTQEALANVARHSQARRVDLSLVYNGDSMQLSLSDNGRGFDMNAKPNGMGLRSIRERVGSVRGTAQIQSAPGQGTRIIVQVPTKS